MAMVSFLKYILSTEEIEQEASSERWNVHKMLFVETLSLVIQIVVHKDIIE